LTIEIRLVIEYPFTAYGKFLGAHRLGRIQEMGARTQAPKEM
jgi:hypothetical protein